MGNSNSSSSSGSSRRRSSSSGGSSRGSGGGAGEGTGGGAGRAGPPAVVAPGSGQNLCRCPQCERRLVVPPGAPVFQCPGCRTTLSMGGDAAAVAAAAAAAAGGGSGGQGGGGAMGMPPSESGMLRVQCIRCRRTVGMPTNLPPGARPVCPCGQPLPSGIDSLISMLLNGSGISGGDDGGGGMGGMGGAGGAPMRRQRSESGASETLIRSLPSYPYKAPPPKKKRAEGAAAAAAAGVVVVGATPPMSPPAADAGGGTMVIMPPAEATADDGGSVGATDEPAGATGTEGAKGAAEAAGAAEAEAEAERERQRMQRQRQQQEEDEEGPCCTVCLCEFEEGEEMTTLPCLHSFHKECCTQWLREKSTCPMCNVDLVKLIQQQEAQTRELMGGLQFDD